VADACLKWVVCVHEHACHFGGGRADYNTAYLACGEEDLSVCHWIFLLNCQFTMFFASLLFSWEENYATA
jgi:hypothetical protein